MNLAALRKTLEFLGTHACISVLNCHRCVYPKIGGARMERIGGDCWKAIAWAKSLSCEDVLSAKWRKDRGDWHMWVLMIGGSSCLNPELEASTGNSGNTMERLRINWTNLRREKKLQRCGLGGRIDRDSYAEICESHPLRWLAEALPGTWHVATVRRQMHSVA